MLFDLFPESLGSNEDWVSLISIWKFLFVIGSSCTLYLFLTTGAGFSSNIIKIIEIQNMLNRIHLFFELLLPFLDEVDYWFDDKQNKNRFLNKINSIFMLLFFKKKKDLLNLPFSLFFFLFF